MDCSTKVKGGGTSERNVAMRSDQAGPLKSNGTFFKSFRQGVQVERGPDMIRFALRNGCWVKNRLEENQVDPSGGHWSGLSMR